MKINYIFLILFALLTFQSFGKDEAIIDSLFTNLKELKDDSIKVNALIELSEMFNETNNEKAIFYARQALNLSNRINYKLGIALSNLNFGDIFFSTKSYQPAINYYLISIKFHEDLGMIDKVAKCYNRIGQIYHIQGKYNLALDNYYLSLERSSEINEQFEIAYSYNYIGGILTIQGNLNEGLDLFQRSSIIRESINDNEGLAASYNNIGEVYRIRGDYEKALDYYKRSLQLNIGLNKPAWYSVNYNNLGLVYLAQKNYEQASASFSKGLSESEKIHDYEVISESLNFLGNYSLEINDTYQAIQYYKRALDVSSSHEVLNEASLASKGLSNTYELIKDYRKAYDYFIQHSNLKDSIANNETHKQLTELQARYDSDKQEQELIVQDQRIKLLERNEKLNDLKLFTLIVGSGLFLVIGILFYGRQISKHKKDKELLEKNEQIHEAKQALMQIELKNKNKELTNFALHIVQKNELLQFIKDDLKKLRSKDEMDRTQCIKDLIITVNQNLRINKELEEFQTSVDNVNYEFFNILSDRFPYLTENEKRLSALLRLNLSSKEIASLNNISIKAVEMGRYRLRKKLQLDQNILLTDFLQSI